MLGLIHLYNGNTITCLCHINVTSDHFSQQKYIHNQRPGIRLRFWVQISKVFNKPTCTTQMLNYLFSMREILVFYQNTVNYKVCRKCQTTCGSLFLFTGSCNVQHLQHPTIQFIQILDGQVWAETLERSLCMLCVSQTCLPVQHRTQV